LNVDSKCLDAMVGKANILIGNWFYLFIFLFSTDNKI
jgi:hypothetical protein